MKAWRASSKAKNWSGKIGKRGTVLLNVFSRIQVKIEIKNGEVMKAGRTSSKAKNWSGKNGKLETVLLNVFSHLRVEIGREKKNAT